MCANHPARIRCAEANGVDAHPAIGSLPGSIHRLWPATVGPIGQEDDDVRLIAVIGAGARLFGPEIETAGRNVRIHLGDGVNRLERGTTDGRPQGSRHIFDGIGQHLLVGRRRYDQLGEVGKGDDADLGSVRLIFDKAQRRLLRDRKPVRFDVGGTHAAGNVQRQDDAGSAEGNLYEHERARCSCEQPG